MHPTQTAPVTAWKVSAVLREGPRANFSANLVKFIIMQCSAISYGAIASINKYTFMGCQFSLSCQQSLNMAEMSAVFYCISHCF